MLINATTPALLLRRYQRFLADVRLECGAEATAHVANPGAMLGLAEPGRRVWLSKAPPGGKLAWRLRLVEEGAGLVGVDTSLPSRLVEEALLAGAIPELAGYPSLRREVAYGEASRIDFLLTAPERPPAYLEVKNVHLHRGQGLAEFPDCKAARSARHMRELAKLAAATGARAVVLFVVQREDCQAFAPAADIDPAFAQALREAIAAGVEPLVYGCRLSQSAVEIARPLKLRLASG